LATRFAHGMCPVCTAQWYPGLDVHEPAWAARSGDSGLRGGRHRGLRQAHAEGRRPQGVGVEGVAPVARRDGE
jgi:hypothetical protein